MALTKKGSRRITVDAVPYRWSIRRRPTYDQGLGAALSFAVEMENFGQTTLVVTIDAARPDNWVNEESAVVTPAIVERAIRHALHEGWQPAEKGGAHAIALPVKLT